MMNFGVSVKNETIGVLVKIIICGILARLIASVTMHVKLMSLNTKTCSCEERLPNKLVLA